MLIRRLSFAAITICLVVVFACASLPKTEKGKYLAARKAFNDTFESYLAQREEADLVTRKLWREKIDPAFRLAATALNIWGLSLGTNGNTTADRSEYVSLRQELSVLLLYYGIISIGD